MEWPVNLTVMWHLLLNSSKLIHICISTHKNCRNYANSIRWHGTKFSESETFNWCIPAVTAYLQFMCTSVCGTCWNTVLGMIGTHCACPCALPWPSNHFTLQSRMNICLHSHSRVEVFIQPFLTSEWWPSTSLSIGICPSPTSSCSSHFLYFRCFSGFMFCSFCWRLQITKLFTMATCSNQKTFFHHFHALFLRS